MLCVSPAPKKKQRNGGQNIKVFVRSRPMNDIERKNKSHSLVTCSTKEVEIQERPYHSKKFSFDRVFDSKSTQTDVYKAVAAPLVDEVLNGFNCTIFAYGQTGTGKTFTMEGDHQDPNNPGTFEDSGTGIIPRCVNHLFDQLRLQQVEFSMRVSFLELYNEELFDLLSAQDDLSKLRLYEDSSRKGSCIIQGLAEVLVRNKFDVSQIIKKGSRKRQTAATLMNATSSRSHTVFTVTVHIKESTEDGDELLRTGKLHLVDLAGSENIGRSGAIDKRAREAGNINMSLLTLGRVITSLVEKTPHIPYRESKLTRLLQDALGGRTKTSIIATISPSSCNLEETLSTLDYAHRAKNIQNRPEVNEKLNKKEVIKGYTNEIDRLRRDLLAMQEKNGVYLALEDYREMIEKIETQGVEMMEKISQIIEMESKMEKQVELFNELSNQLCETNMKLSETDRTLSKTQDTLSATQTLLSHTAQEKDEQIYLLNAHKNTESILLEEGNKLVNLAGTTTDDINSLQTKLEKKADIESKNEELASEFLKKFETNKRDIHADLAMFIVSQQETVQKRAKEMSDVSNLNLSNTKENLTFIKNLKELQDYGFVDIKGSFEKQQKTFSLMNSSTVESSLELCTDGEYYLKALQEESIPLFEKMKSIAGEQMMQVSKFREEHSEKINGWSGLCSANHRTLNEICNRHKDKIHASAMECESEIIRINTDIIKQHKVDIENLAKMIRLNEDQYKLLLEESTNNRSNLTALMSSVDDVRKEMEAKILKLQQLQQQIQSLQVRENEIGIESLQLNSSICEQRLDYDRKVSNFASKLPTLLEGVMNGVSSANMFAIEGCNSAIKASMNHDNEAQNVLNDLDGEILSFADDETKKASNIIKVCSNLECSVDNNFDANSRVISMQKSTLNEYLEKSKELSMTSFNEFSSYIERESKSLSDNLGNLELDLKENEAKMSASLAEIGANLNANSSHLEQFFTTHIENLRDSEDHISFLLTKDLGKYISTGFTPLRKVYQYPQYLKATSPHEILLARYNAQMKNPSKIPLPSLSFEEIDSDLADTSDEKSSPLIESECASNEQKILRSGSFKEPHLPPPLFRQASREDIKIKSAPISRSSSTSSIGDSKENNPRKRELRQPSKSKIQSFSNEKLNEETHSKRDPGRVRKVLGAFN